VVDRPRIVEEHGPSVWRTAYRLLSDQHEANDCYQESFLAVLEYSRKSEVTNWSGLLKRITTARALDRLRRRYRDRSEPLENGAVVVGREEAPDRPLQRAEWMDELRKAMATLPEQQADVFWLREVEKLDNNEIAEHLKATTSQVATWLHRAKQRLRRVLVERGIAGEVKQ